jgi:hypothetical protein
MDPLKLLARGMLAGFKIVGYSLACLAQSLWYVAHGKRELIGHRSSTLSPPIAADCAALGMVGSHRSSTLEPRRAHVPPVLGMVGSHRSSTLPSAQQLCNA